MVIPGGSGCRDCEASFRIRGLYVDEPLFLEAAGSGRKIASILKDASQW